MVLESEQPLERLKSEVKPTVNRSMWGQFPTALGPLRLEWESAGGHDPYYVPFQENHNISCVRKWDFRLDKKWPVSLEALTTHYKMGNPSYRMTRLVEGLLDPFTFWRWG